MWVGRDVRRFVLLFGKGVNVVFIVNVLLGGARSCGPYGLWCGLLIVERGIYASGLGGIRGNAFLAWCARGPYPFFRGLETSVFTMPFLGIVGMFAMTTRPIGYEVVAYVHGKFVRPPGTSCGALYILNGEL